MAKVVLGTTMSLDGFIADRNGDLSPLYPDLEELRNTEMLQINEGHRRCCNGQAFL